MARTYGVALIPWSPLAGGFLTGKYKSNEKPSGTRYENVSEPNRGLFTDQSFEALSKIEKLAEKKGCTVSQFALAWCADQPGVTSPIIGPRTMDQLMDNLGAAEVGISGDDKKRIDEIVPPGTFLADYYQADFGPASHSWCG